MVNAFFSPQLENTHRKRMETVSHSSGKATLQEELMNNYTQTELYSFEIDLSTMLAVHLNIIVQIL